MFFCQGSIQTLHSRCSSKSFSSSATRSKITVASCQPPRERSTRNNIPNTFTMSRRSVFVFAVIALICTVGQSRQPAYQVSLFAQLQPNEPPTHICSGIIVHNRLVLTTATCISYQLTANGSQVNIPVSALKVMAGANSDVFTDLFSYAVSDVIVNEKFNSTTLTNDLALIRLQTALPLADQDHMQWIILEEPVYKDGSCLVEFSSSSRHGTEIAKKHNIPIWESVECAGELVPKFMEARKLDICSYFIVPKGQGCKILNSTMLHNTDRGAGLVCNNRLVGLFSSIVPGNNFHSLNCAYRERVAAFYTNVGPHMAWIYEIIANEEYKAILENHYMYSLPYHAQERSALKELITTDSSVASIATDEVETTTNWAVEGFAEALSNYNGSAASTQSHTMLFSTLALSLLCYI